MRVPIPQWGFLMTVAMAVNWFLKPLEIARPQSSVWRTILGAFVRFTPDTRHDINYPRGQDLSDSLPLSNTELSQEEKKPSSNAGTMVKDIEL